MIREYGPSVKMLRTHIVARYRDTLRALNAGECVSHTELTLLRMQVASIQPPAHLAAGYDALLGGSLVQIAA
jgi:hypothetical protein